MAESDQAALPTNIAQGSDYSPMAKTLHWLTAFLILGMFVTGVSMTDGGFEGEVRAALYTSHKTMGIFVLLITLLRLVWRHIARPPQLPLSIMPAWQIHAARAAHLGLYLLLVVVPMTGWIMTTLGPYGIQLFGLIPFPAFPFVADMENAGALRGFLNEAHESLAVCMATILVVHIGAAFLHHFVDRDDVLLRMSPAGLRNWLEQIRD